MGAAVLASLAGLLPGQPSPLAQAEKLHRYTDYQGSLKILLPLGQKDARVFSLIGRNYFSLGDFKNATEALEQAVAAEPENSMYYLWLGRAYGRRAETSSPFTAPGLAVKARQSFERAVSLNPRNAEALNDLFAYYLEAPGFLGGGQDKAARLVAEIGKLDAAEASFALAQLAEKRKEYATAEQQLRRAVDLAPRQVGRVLDLARFLARRGKVDEAEAAFAKARQIAPDSPKVLFERAATYVETKRNLDVARDLLKQYLNSRLTADDPSREEARRLLKQAGA